MIYEDEDLLNHIGVSIVITIDNFDVVLKQEGHAVDEFKYETANDLLAELITKAEAILTVDEVVGANKVHLIKRDDND